MWLIDFAKTVQLPANTEITHSNKWSVGNHEDGYLIGINNLIGIFEDMVNMPTPASLSPSSSDEKISGHSMCSSRSHSLDDAAAAAPVLPKQDSATDAGKSTTTPAPRERLQSNVGAEASSTSLTKEEKI